MSNTPGELFLKTKKQDKFKWLVPCFKPRQNEAKMTRIDLNNFKRITSLIVLIILNSNNFWAFEDAVLQTVELPPIILGQGEQRLIKIPDLVRYSLGGNAVKILPIPTKKQYHDNALLIKGAVIGNSDLWVWKKNNRLEHRTITVEKNASLPRAERDLLKTLAQLEECEIIYSGEKIIVRGTVLTNKERGKISALSRLNPNKIFDETILSDSLVKETKTALKNWLGANNLSNKLIVSQFGNDLWVEGAIKDFEKRKELERQILSLFPITKIKLHSLPDNAPTVYFRVFLLEVKHHTLSSIGIGWPAQKTGAFTAAPWKLTPSLDLDLTLNFLEQNGDLNILSRPELVVRAPGEAEFFAGGELPIKVRNKYTSNINWKPYGLTLRLKVTHSDGERIRLDIHTEISQLDANIGDNQTPGLQSNRMKTQVDAYFGIPLLLSGLLQNSTRKQVQGLPFLKQIPILGSLFGSEDFLQEKSELVAILLPAAVPPKPSSHLSRNFYPSGPIPIPRNWISPQEEMLIQNHPEYPWNALK